MSLLCRTKLAGDLPSRVVGFLVAFFVWCNRGFAVLLLRGYVFFSFWGV